MKPCPQCRELTDSHFVLDGDIIGSDYLDGLCLKCLSQLLPRDESTSPFRMLVAPTIEERFSCRIVPAVSLLVGSPREPKHSLELFQFWPTDQKLLTLALASFLESDPYMKGTR